VLDNFPETNRDFISRSGKVEHQLRAQLPTLAIARFRPDIGGETMIDEYLAGNGDSRYDERHILSSLLHATMIIS